MADNKDNQEEIKIPERKVPAVEQGVNFKQENIAEKKEISEDDKRISAELRREIDMMELDPSTKKDAEVEREKIEYLGQKEKLEHLLQIAREKGIVFAVHIANKMGDASIVDTLHDILAKKGYYKDLLGKGGSVNDDDDDNDKKT